MKLLAGLILYLGIVTLWKTESTEKDKVVKEPWKTCAPLYGLNPENYAYVMNAKNRGVIGCLYKRIGLLSNFTFIDERRNNVVKVLDTSAMSDSSASHRITKNFTISQRWITVSLGFLGIFNAFAMRVCLSIAITEMASAPHRTVSNKTDETCAENLNYNHTKLVPLKHSNGMKYDWSEEMQGLILSSFYWGYIFSCVLGGVICQKFGGKHTLGLNILLTSIFTLLTPYCIMWGGATSFIILRVAMGLGEGTTYPAVSDLLAKWIPEDERSKAGTVAFTGAPLGTIFGMLMSGVILQHSENGWPMVFYFYGTFGVISFLLNAALCFNSPSENPYISGRELRYLKNKLKNTHTDLPPIPWRYILKSPAVWSSIIAKFGNAYGFLTIISDMPKYMSSVLKFSALHNGFFSSIPHLSMWLGGILTCWIADKIITEKIMSITVVRKIGCAISLVGPAIFLVAASYAGCDGFLVVVLQSIALALMGCSFFSIIVNAVDLSPNYASSIMGLGNGFAVIGGAVSPYIVGVITSNQTINEWRLVFWIVFAIFIICTSVYLIYGSGKVQEWNDPAFLKGEKSPNRTDVKEGLNLLPVNEK